MKIELNNNKIFYKNGSSVQEIHPFWLRERANGEKYLDKKTQQRLFDPTSLNVEIAIKSARINNDLLEIDFNDGVNSKLNIEKIFKVNVLKVNTITKKSKKKIVRGKIGVKKGYKKALVTLKKGQSIDLAVGV